MIQIENTKTVLMISPELKDNGAYTSNTGIDTKGYKHLRVIMAVGATDIATTAAPALAESTAVGGTYTAITVPTTAALADAISATEDGGIFIIDVDLTQARERFIKCLVTAGDGTAGTALAVIGILSKPDAGTISISAGATEAIIA